MGNLYPEKQVEEEEHVLHAADAAARHDETKTTEKPKNIFKSWSSKLVL